MAAAKEEPQSSVNWPIKTGVSIDINGAMAHCTEPRPGEEETSTAGKNALRIRAGYVVY